MKGDKADNHYQGKRFGDGKPGGSAWAGAKDATSPRRSIDMGIVSLHRLSELQKFTLLATDGEIGSIEEIYFDDSTWTVRYFVVNAGNWLTGRRVLISSVAIGDIDDGKGEIAVELSRDQIKGSPPLGSERPVSRQYETDYFRYYGWPPYWESAPFPPPLPTINPDKLPGGEQRRRRLEDSHLRSSKEVMGYRISAEDGEFGHVADFVIDDKNSSLCYLEIDTRNWWPGKHVLLNPAWIAEINWPKRSVVVDLSREAIRSAPAYDPKSVISRDYEIALFEHYARRKYWE